MKLKVTIVERVGFKRYCIQSQDESRRFLLGEPEEINYLFIGLNPSKASALRDDNTMRRIKSFSLQGNRGWLIGNLCPLSSTDPKELPLTLDALDISLNQTVINYTIAEFKVEKVIFCWGDNIKTRSYFKEQSNKLLEIIDENLQFCIGSLSKTGNPRHPLYLSSNTEIVSLCI